MAPLAETGLVCKRHNSPQAIALEMIALFDHPADLGEAVEAPLLTTPEGVELKMRHDQIKQLRGRPALVLESAVTAGLSDRATSKVDLQIAEERSIPFVQRERERWAHLNARPELGSKREGNTEASFSLGQARDEPRI